mgnify:CR=1 FL=1
MHSLREIYYNPDVLCLPKKQSETIVNITGHQSVDNFEGFWAAFDWSYHQFIRLLETEGEDSTTHRCKH